MSLEEYYFLSGSQDFELNRGGLKTGSVARPAYTLCRRVSTSLSNLEIITLSRRLHMFPFCTTKDASIPILLGWLRCFATIS